MNAPNTQYLAQLQSLLLDLISPTRSVEQSQIEVLAPNDWKKLMEMVRMYRLGPLLHWQLGRAHAHLTLAPEIRIELEQSFKTSTFRNLTLQRELLLVHKVLEKANIPHVAMKGAYLAFHAYPQAALRPLRDLDILVSREKALNAYQTLVEGGLARMGKYPGSPEAVIQLHHHLPPLLSPSRLVSVELHSRVFHVENDDEQKPDLSDDPQFWQRCVNRKVASASVSFESPTDLLLHMIVHAVYDHQFDNGPMLLSDLAFLLDTQAIDWPLFWSLAERCQRARGCLLALKLTERYWGYKPIIWPEASEVDTVSFSAKLDRAALLMLRDSHASGAVGLGTEIERKTSLAAKVFTLLSKVIPPKNVIAAMYPVSEHSPFVYLWYPVKWWRIATLYLPQYLRSRQHLHLQNEVRQIAELERWLGIRSSE